MKLGITRLIHNKEVTEFPSFLGHPVSEQIQYNKKGLMLIHNKERIAFVSEFQCLLGHPEDKKFVLIMI